MILRKLAFYVVTAVAAVTVDFFIPHAMPGNPVEAVLARLQGNFTPATSPTGSTPTSRCSGSTSASGAACCTATSASRPAATRPR
jgi:ABC-type microcin C transport system permease subunit YejB